MSEIPYYFDTPVPSYFRKAGWFENENAFKFIHWAFARCQNVSHKVVIQNKEYILEPFEFVAGRLSSHKECFLTEKQFRGIADRMQKEGLLKKTANTKANKFTCYIWVKERFLKTEGQHKGQQRANRGPTEGHEVNYKIITTKSSSPPLVPKKKEKEEQIKKKSIQLVKFCEEKKLPFSPRAITKNYNLYPQACVDVLNEFYNLPPARKTDINNPDQFLKKKVFEQHEFLELKKDYQ